MASVGLRLAAFFQVVTAPDVMAERRAPAEEVKADAGDKSPAIRRRDAADHGLDFGQIGVLGRPSSGRADQQQPLRDDHAEDVVGKAIRQLKGGHVAERDLHDDGLRLGLR